MKRHVHSALVEVSRQEPRADARGLLLAVLGLVSVCTVILAEGAYGLTRTPWPELDRLVVVSVSGGFFITLFQPLIWAIGTIYVGLVEVPE